MERKPTTIEVIGWTLGGITVAIAFAVFAVVATVTVSANTTERLVACVEAGLVWVQGICI